MGEWEEEEEEWVGGWVGGWVERAYPDLVEMGSFPRATVIRARPRLVGEWVGGWMGGWMGG